MKHTRYIGRLVHKRFLTHDIVKLRIELIDPPSIHFVAGQFVRFQSEEYEGREAVTRTYSIASVPSDAHHINLIIRRVPNGICTTWVFDYLQEGQRVSFSGPYGKFHLSDTDAPMILIAGGSGMAPIWSMLWDMKEKGLHRKATYFFGALSQRDLFFVDSLYELQNKLPDFTFIPALSSEPIDSDWKGERGLITDVVGRYYPDCSHHEAYLCGSPGMIDACIKVLIQGGMPEDRIFYDKFNPS